MDAMIRRREKEKLFSHRTQITAKKAPNLPTFKAFQHFTAARAPVIIRRRSAAVYPSRQSLARAF